MEKFSTKLLFQFHVKDKGLNNVRRLCEERITNYAEEGVRRALIYSNPALRIENPAPASPLGGGGGTITVNGISL
jgi:hypothetical protein